MPQEDSKIKKCRLCSLVLTEENTVKKQRLCRTCNSKLCKEYKQNNKNIISSYNKKYKSEHKEEIKKYNHDYNIENRTTIQKRHTKYLRERRKTDINYKLSVNCRNKIKKMVKVGYSSFKLVGCTPDFLKEWLRFNFKPGMTFENYGSHWHIDHVVPVYHFKLTDDKQLKECFHWTNLQPLEADKNHSKQKYLDKYEVVNHVLLVEFFSSKNKLETNANNLLKYALK